MVTECLWNKISVLFHMPVPGSSSVTLGKHWGFLCQSLLSGKERLTVLSLPAVCSGEIPAIKTVIALQRITQL